MLTTHNVTFGYEADRVITLEDGRIVKEENPREKKAADSERPMTGKAAEVLEAAAEMATGRT